MMKGWLNGFTSCSDSLCCEYSKKSTVTVLSYRLERPTSALKTVVMRIEKSFHLACGKGMIKSKYDKLIFSSHSSCMFPDMYI